MSQNYWLYFITNVSAVWGRQDRRQSSVIDRWDFSSLGFQTVHFINIFIKNSEALGIWNESGHTLYLLLL